MVVLLDGRVAASTLVLDTTVLHHAALADRLDVLGDYKCLTTRVVLDEIRRNADTQPDLRRVARAEWLHVAELDTIEDLNRFATWVSRLGNGTRHHGEASVFACAETQGAIAITDDKDATRIGRRFGVEVHGTLWILVRACQAGQLTLTAAGVLIDELRRTGARLPCAGDGFSAWCTYRRLDVSGSG